MSSPRRGVYERRGACDEIRTATAHGGWIACVTAARHHGLWVLDDEALHVGLRSHGRAYAHDNCSCVVHWSDDDAKGSAYGLPSIRAVVRQVLRCRGIDSFFVVLESALRQGRLSSADLQWLGQHTNAQAREAI